MKVGKFFFTFALWILCAGLPAYCATAASSAGEPRDLPLLQSWNGDYPVSQLDRLPEGQRRSGVGYLGDAARFADLWQALKPGEKAPEVDFGKCLVIFSRNVHFYNRISIFKVTLKDGVLEVMAMGTRSALPIEDKVAMALAVVPRAGVKFIQAGSKRIPVVDEAGLERGAAVDPLHASYVVEGQEVRLVAGCGEVKSAPGSATKIRTSVFGKPVYGDLDGDGVDDAALFLVQQPGGSGTFYYVAAALNVNGAYRGTNAVLLGDRIAPQNVAIRNGLVVANYADRRSEEPMSAPPSVGRSKYLTLKDGTLAAVEPLGEAEQVLEGWVTIGHEVRSFRPCSRKTDLWLLGTSPALKEIMAAYHEALPHAKPYTPLFMVVAGNYAALPAEGFGVQYEAAFFATQLLRVWPRGNCTGGYIVVDSPAAGALVTSPLRVRGEARGSWFFEGDFPLVLKDGRGKVVATGFCTAKKEWMTDEFVPFEGTVEFRKPSSGNQGLLILKKNNPTGRPEHDDALEIPVFFK
jgi:Immunoglobulin-like domain of bacterial spore germination